MTDIMELTDESLELALSLACADLAEACKEAPGSMWYAACREDVSTLSRESMRRIRAS